MLSLFCLFHSSCIWIASGNSIYHTCRQLQSSHLHNSHFNPFKSGIPNHNNRLHYFSYTVIPYSIRSPFFFVYISRFVWLCFFRLFLVACALSLSLSLCPLLLTFFVFPTCHGLCLPNKEWEKKKKKLRRQTLLVFSVKLLSIFVFRSVQINIAVKKNSGAVGGGGVTELKSYLSRPEHYFIICCQSWLPLRLPDETALS